MIYKNSGPTPTRIEPASTLRDKRLIILGKLSAFIVLVIQNT